MAKGVQNKIVEALKAVLPEEAHFLVLGPRARGKEKEVRHVAEDQVQADKHEAGGLY